MLETSVDILYLTIAACVLILTIMLAIGLYYVIVMLKRAKEVTDIMKEKIAKVAAIVDIFHSKLEPAAHLAAGIAGGVKQVVDFLKKRGEKKAGKARRKGVL